MSDKPSKTYFKQALQPEPDPLRDAVLDGIGQPDRMAMLAIRGAAYFIDLVVFALPIALLHRHLSIPKSGTFALALIAFSFFGVLGILESTVGGTPGKLLMRLRVIDARGKKPNIFRAVARRCLLLVDCFFGGLVGIVAILKSRKAQRVGDSVTETFVVDTMQLTRVTQALEQNQRSRRAVT